MATSITVNGKTHNVEAAADRSGDCGRDRQRNRHASARSAVYARQSENGAGL